jgi:hypothetical protein
VYVKTAGFDYASPEVIQLIKELVINHLAIELCDQNIPADTGQGHWLFQLWFPSLNIVPE